MSDFAPLRDLTRDPRGGRTCSLGIVTAEDDNHSHYEVRSTGGDATDIWVRVVLMPEERAVWTRMAGGGGNRGVFAIPHAGRECVVLSPGGEIHADHVLVAVLGSGAVPGDADDTHVIITGDNVRIEAIGTGEVVINGGTLNIARETDPVSVNFPFGYTDGLGATHGAIGGTDVSGTITSGSAGDGRMKG
jgi:phage baseplate assembly protein gpV